MLAWVNPDDSAKIPRQFESIFAQNEFIVISAAKIGNDQPWQRRIAILESGITQLAKTMHFDSGKRIISGFSGGGRISALACFIHPEFGRLQFHGPVEIFTRLTKFTFRLVQPNKELTITIQILFQAIKSRKHGVTAVL